MLNSFKVAYALIRIPRLFGSLLLLPLLLSLALVTTQIVVSGLIISVVKRDSKTVASHHDEGQSFVRRIILGQSQPLAAPQICRWISGTAADGTPGEVPPSDDCHPDRLDVALQVENPRTFDPSAYVQLVQGNVARVHLCQHCEPDIIIRIKKGRAETEVRSIWALTLSNLFYRNEGVSSLIIKLTERSEEIGQLMGKRSLLTSGFRSPVSISGLQTTMVFAINISMLIIIALWLALKAHRRVLDYFARNGALLPMVAATGKRSFYGAIWVITLIRVGVFLLASVPLTYLSFQDIGESAQTESVFHGDTSAVILWGLAIFASLGLATLVASIADLKHRQHLSSILYRYVPIILSLAGAAVWGFTFILDGETPALVRNIIASLPIAGITPILVAPIFKPEFNVLALHTLLTVALFILALKHNSNWFAAHLEEL